MATFRAIIAPTPGAIKVSGDGNGARILLDVCETELADALELLGMRNVLLRVTIEPCNDQANFGGPGDAERDTPRESRKLHI